MSEHITNTWTVYRNSAYYEILSGGLEIANTCPASCQGDIALGATIAEHIVKCVNGYAKLEQQRNALLEAVNKIKGDAEYAVICFKELQGYIDGQANMISHD